MTKRNQRHKRGTDWSKITDQKLSEILSHPHCQGTDGVDYEPYIDELLSEQYKRQNARSMEAQHRMEQEHKQYLRHLNESNKSKKRIK